MEENPFSLFFVCGSKFFDESCLNQPQETTNTYIFSLVSGCTGFFLGSYKATLFVRLHIVYTNCMIDSATLHKIGADGCSAHELQVLILDYNVRARAIKNVL